MLQASHVMFPSRCQKSEILPPFSKSDRLPIRVMEAMGFAALSSSLIYPGDSRCWMKANLSLSVQSIAVGSQSPGPALRRENRLRHEFLAPKQWHGDRRVAGLHSSSDPFVREADTR